MKPKEKNQLLCPGCKGDKFIIEENIPICTNCGIFLVDCVLKDSSEVLPRNKEILTCPRCSKTVFNITSDDTKICANCKARINRKSSGK